MLNSSAKQMYDDFDPAVQIYRKKCAEIHNKKITSAKGKLDVQQTQERIGNQLESFRYNRKKNNDFNQKTRNMLLTMENHKLVKKIEGIHFRPPQIATVSPDYKNQPVKSSSKRNSSSFKRGSLNYITRKAENDRIYQENMILFSKLKRSTAILRKSDMDDAYSKHKKMQQYMSKADKIAVNILATQQVSPAKSSMKGGYMTSHRSVTTLPPITDMKNKRQSVPAAYTPKLAIHLADTHNTGSRQLLSMKTPDQINATHSQSSSQKMKEENQPSVLPKLQTERVSAAQSPSGNQRLNSPRTIIEKRVPLSTKNKGSLAGSRLKILSPNAIMMTPQFTPYNHVLQSQLEGKKKRRKKSKRKRNQESKKAFDISIDGNQMNRSPSIHGSVLDRRQGSALFEAQPRSTQGGKRKPSSQAKNVNNPYEPQRSSGAKTHLKIIRNKLSPSGVHPKLVDQHLNQSHVTDMRSQSPDEIESKTDLQKSFSKQELKSKSKLNESKLQEISILDEQQVPGGEEGYNLDKQQTLLVSDMSAVASKSKKTQQEKDIETPNQAQVEQLEKSENLNRQRTPDQASQGRVSQDRASQERASQVRASQERASQERASQERASQDRASQGRASQGRASQERASQERASQEDQTQQ